MSWATNMLETRSGANPVETRRKIYWEATKIAPNFSPSGWSRDQPPARLAASRVVMPIFHLQ